jgi:hypothetical protein
MNIPNTTGIINLGGIYRTNKDHIPLRISATTGSLFEVTGGVIAPWIGYETGAYQITGAIDLIPNTTQTTIQTLFMK